MYIPEVWDNLLSLSWVDKVGGQAVCTKGAIEIQDASTRPIIQGTYINNLYYLHISTETPELAQVSIKLKRTYTWEQWHCKMDHIGMSGLKHLYDNHLADGFIVQDSPETFDCMAYIQTKHIHVPLPKSDSQ